MFGGTGVTGIESKPLVFGSKFFDPVFKKPFADTPNIVVACIQSPHTIAAADQVSPISFKAGSWADSFGTTSSGTVEIPTVLLHESDDERSLYDKIRINSTSFWILVQGCGLFVWGGNIDIVVER